MPYPTYTNFNKKPGGNTNKRSTLPLKVGGTYIVTEIKHGTGKNGKAWELVKLANEKGPIKAFSIFSDQVPSGLIPNAQVKVESISSATANAEEFNGKTYVTLTCNATLVGTGTLASWEEEKPEEEDDPMGGLPF